MELVELDEIVPFDVWRKKFDEDGKPTGMIVRDHWLRREDVFKSFRDYMNAHLICQACDAVRQEEHGDSFEHEPCGECGGEMCWYIDEYLLPCNERTNPSLEHIQPIRVVCFPVTGGSEGHYVHVGWLYQGHDDHVDSDPRFFCLALIKTFRGWDAAVELANRAARAMGA